MTRISGRTAVVALASSCLACVSLFSFARTAAAACSIQTFTANPSSPRTVGTSISLYAKASCGGGVRAIRFKVDGNIVYEIGAPEGTATWNTSGSSAGSHTISVEAAELSDNNWSNPATSSLTYRLDAGSPTSTPLALPSCDVQSFSFNPPSPRAPGSLVSIYAKASCNTGVRAIRFKVDGNIIYELGAAEATAVWNTSGTALGEHMVSVEAAGQGDDSWSRAASRSNGYTLQPNDVPPTRTPTVSPICQIQTLSTNPPSPRLPGLSVAIYAKASCTTGVRAIRFKVDGNIIYELGAAEATAAWSTIGASLGEHVIAVEAAGLGDSDWSAAARQTTSYTLQQSQEPPRSTSTVSPSCQIQGLSTTPSSPQIAGVLVAIYGKASCTTGVRAIRFKVDGNIVYEIGASEATATWNTSGVSLSDHTISVEAAAQGDNNWTYAAAQSIDFTLQRTIPPPLNTPIVKASSVPLPPGITPTSRPTPIPSPQTVIQTTPTGPFAVCSVSMFNAIPASPQAPGTLISLVGKASCSSGVRALRFRVDGVIIYEQGGAEASAVWNTTGAAEGNHIVLLEAAAIGDDDWRLATSKSLNVVLSQGGPQSQAPQSDCVIQSLSIDPQIVEVGNTAALVGEAKCKSGLRAVRLKVDGAVVQEVGIPSIKHVWKSAGTWIGNHDLSIEAVEWGTYSWAHAVTRQLPFTVTGAQVPAMVWCPATTTSTYRSIADMWDTIIEFKTHVSVEQGDLKISKNRTIMTSLDYRKLDTDSFGLSWRLSIGFLKRPGDWTIEYKSVTGKCTV